MDKLLGSQSVASLWNEHSWPISDSTDEGSEVFPITRPPWSSMPCFTERIPAFSVDTSVHLPMSATAPDGSSWILPWMGDPNFEEIGAGEDHPIKYDSSSDQDDDDEGKDDVENDKVGDNDERPAFKKRRSEIEPELARARDQCNNLRRPSGNNPYGSRGCESCVACRRRKGKVSTLPISFG